MTTTFKAKFDRQGDNWLVELVEEPRVHTFGRTLARAKAMIVDATALWYELDIADVAIDGEIELHFGDTDLDAAVGEARRAQAAEQLARDDEIDKVGRAIDELSSAGVSLRDIAVVLGMSHQRVHQIHAVWTTSIGIDRHRA